MHMRDGADRETTLTARRLVHMAQPHMAAIEWVLQPENWLGRVTVRSALDGRVENAGVLRYRRLAGDHLALVMSDTLGPDGMYLVAETRQSHLRVAQRFLRLHVFHLLQTLSPHTADLDVGVPARGLHGEAYRGHVFWDELFVLPYLNTRLPEVTAALLRYRYRRLNAARRLARAAGFAGALYPWQSGSDGREESQVLHLNRDRGAGCRITRTCSGT